MMGARSVSSVGAPASQGNVPGLTKLVGVPMLHFEMRAPSWCEAPEEDFKEQASLTLVRSPSVEYPFQEQQAADVPPDAYASGNLRNEALHAYAAATDSYAAATGSGSTEALHALLATSAERLKQQQDVLLERKLASIDAERISSKYPCSDATTQSLSSQSWESDETRQLIERKLAMLESGRTSSKNQRSDAGSQSLSSQSQNSDEPRRNASRLKWLGTVSDRTAATHDPSGERSTVQLSYVNSLSDITSIGPSASYIPELPFPSLQLRKDSASVETDSTSGVADPFVL